MSVKLSAEIPIGADWAWTVTWYSDDNETIPEDLTSYTARMQIRRKPSSPDTIHEMTTENGGISLGGTDGTISLAITDTDSAEFPPGTARGQLEMIDPGGIVTRLLDFDFTLSQEVTR